MLTDRLNHKPTISIILSFFNEAEVIPELLQRLRDVLRGELKKGCISEYELIFINDASTDVSRAMLTNESELHGDIRLINMSRNFGVSPCVFAGLDHCESDLAIFMDADLQDPPEVIPQMLEAWRSDSEVEVVHTVRYAREGETAVKMIVTRIGYRILRQFASIDLQIEAGDFKLVGSRALAQLKGLKEKRPFTRGLVSWIGFKQVSITYKREARFAGETKFPIFSLGVIRNFLSSALISFSDMPLQLSSLVGVAVSFLALLYALLIVVQKIFGFLVEPWSYVLLAVMFFSGIQLLSIGMIGLYLSAIHLESKRRPNYIVDTLVGFKHPPTNHAL